MLTGLALILAVSPAPSASPAPQCPRDAQLVYAARPQVDPRQLPVHMPRGGISVLTEATIGPDGKLVSVKIVQSADSFDLDSAALAAARFSTWEAKMIRADDGTCKPVTGTVLFKVTFTPNQ